MTVKAVAYARISKDKVLGGVERLAVDRQLEAIHEYAQKKGIEVVKEYVDNSVSATSGVKRPAFEEMLASRPEVIIVWHYDRLIRVSKDLERLLDTRAVIHQATDSDLDLVTVQGRMMARVLTSLASYETEHKVERQLAKNRQLARDGVYRGTHAPLGNLKTGEITEAGYLLRELLLDYIDGKTTIYGIAQRLNEAGYGTPYGNPWNTATVRRLMSRPSLMGYQDYKGERYALRDWQPILTEEQYQHVQARIEARKTSQRRDRWESRSDISMLTQIAVCHECGKGMNVGYARGKKDDNRRHYKCPYGHVSVSAPQLEQIMAIKMTDFVRTDTEEKAQQEKRQRFDELTHKISDLEQSRETWLDGAIKSGLAPALIARYEENFEEQVEALRQERVMLSSDPELLIYNGLDVSREGPTLSMLVESFDRLSVSTQRDLIRHYFKRVVVGPGIRGKHANLVTTTERLTFEYTERVDGFMVARSLDTFFDVVGRDSPEPEPDPNDD